MNKMESINNIEIITQILRLFSAEYRDLFGIDLVVVLLFNICKNILPFIGTQNII